jgi:hypothetical protein
MESHSFDQEGVQLGKVLAKQVLAGCGGEKFQSIRRFVLSCIIFLRNQVIAQKCMAVFYNTRKTIKTSRNVVTDIKHAFPDRTHDRNALNRK